MLYFKEHLPEGCTIVTPQQALECIQSYAYLILTSLLIYSRYINRFSDEIEQMRSELRKGRPKPAKLVSLEMICEKDENDFRSGTFCKSSFER